VQFATNGTRIVSDSKDRLRAEILESAADDSDLTFVVKDFRGAESDQRRVVITPRHSSRSPTNPDGEAPTVTISVMGRQYIVPVTVTAFVCSASICNFA
jgi:hypothetical protein